MQVEQLIALEEGRTRRCRDGATRRQLQDQDRELLVKAFYCAADRLLAAKKTDCVSPAELVDTGERLLQWCLDKEKKLLAAEPKLQDKPRSVRGQAEVCALFPSD